MTEKCKNGAKYCQGPGSTGRRCEKCWKEEEEEKARSEKESHEAGDVI